jgi:hypothetical protein
MRNKSLYSVPAMFVIALTILSACSSAATATPTAAVISAPTVAPVSAATQAPVAQNSGSGTGSSSIQWPSAMPTDVPVFTYGTITGSNNNIMGNIQGAFDNVPAEAFTNYQSDLKTAGWTITVATQSTDGFEIDASKGARTVVAMFVSTQKTGLTGAVTYNGHVS